MPPRKVLTLEEMMTECISALASKKVKILALSHGVRGPGDTEPRTSDATATWVMGLSRSLELLKRDQIEAGFACLVRVMSCSIRVEASSSTRVSQRAQKFVSDMLLKGELRRSFDERRKTPLVAS